MSPMLTFATDFWPLLGAIMGAGALVTVALSVLIATISPAGSRPRRRHQLALTPAELADRHAGQDYPKAA